MSLILNPRLEARIVDYAKREGIEPADLIEKLVEGYQPLPTSKEHNELGGKTIGELYGHLLGSVSFEPSDLAERDEEYPLSSGFGETSSRRDLSS
jgi:hypothetical protein